ILNDPDLKLNDFAVITHDMELYQQEIEQVFESIHQLPYHLIDGISGSAGRLEEAVNSLLGLCFTEYSRRDLFKLINNPCFLSKFEENEPAGKSKVIEELKIDQWLKWADDLNVFFGIDSESQKKHGYHHLEKNIYHWEQAFQRLTLGEIFASEIYNETNPNESQNLIAVDLPDELSLEAARFMLIVRSLIEDTRYLTEWEMKGKEWGLYLQTLIKTYLKPISESDKEVFQNLLQNAVSINDLDKGQMEGFKKFGFSTIFEFFKQKQQKSLLHRGHYLAEGVTVSSFQPMRPIPFKAVFLLGMGEGLFPAPYHRDTLDLRFIPVRLNTEVQGNEFRERRLGDVSVTERDRYMFLETLVSTGKHLVMSYVSRNDRTDEETNPSSIIQTLTDELESGYLNKKFSKIEHPLKSYSLEYFSELNVYESIESLDKKNLPNYDPASFRQAKALRSRELFDEKYPGLQRISPEFFPDELKQTFSFEFNNEVSQQSISNKRISSVSISRLRKFLESPLQSTANNLLGMSEDEIEIEEKTEEPLELDRLSEWSLLRKIWDNSLKFLKTEHDWSLFYEFQTQRMMLEGKMPSGIFGEANRAKHIRILKSWQKNLISLLDTNWETLANNIFQFHFGGLRKDLVDQGISSSYKLIRPLRLQFDYEALSEVEKTTTVINGKTEWWYTNDSKNWKCIFFCERQIKEKDWLRHFLDVVILREANLIPDGVNVTGFCVNSDGKVRSRRINLPTKEQSKEYLANIVQEINNEGNAILMPVESVLELSKENLSASEYNSRFNEWMERKLLFTSEKMGISSQYGPVKFFEDVPFPENPRKLMNSRFGLFFETFSM
ncbi:exodeoxyribonuclease V subunit gamma, partial [bacterium]|nr:exodeoxyribonuclease V subunit gamma [bacterium]